MMTLEPMRPERGRYTIRRKIADGGMAEIFLATQHGAEGFERPVVLKRILAALVADPQFRNMMIDEAHVAMSLNHSNIVQVLDLGQSKGRYFLVLEFVDGWDLNQILRRVAAIGFALPPELALYMSSEVCRALAYAHGKSRGGKALDIVHRDISPHNVLISEQGEVKLTDFGIAKAFGRRERTGQGVIKGKLAFMSPEQASGGDLDARSDLFSVGTMLYLMTTGKRPFEAPTDLEAILRVRQCEFQPAETVKPDMPPKLAAVIRRAMKLEPAERYHGADEMLVDLEAVQRTAFQPAGQTELKRWLAELQRRDGTPPIGKSTAPTPMVSDLHTLDLVEGEDLVFDDSEVVSPPMRPSNAPPPLPPAAATTVTPTPPQPLRVRRGLLLFLMGAGTVGLYTRFGPGQQEPEPPPEPTRTPTAAEPTPPAADPTPLPAAAPSPADATSATSEPPPDATAGVAEDALEGDVLDPGETGPTEENEEALLQKSEPNPEDEIIGEESAPAPPPPPTLKKPASTRVAPQPEPPSRERPVVSVRISTRPDGAVIRLKSRVFGRAPMNLRFRSGVTYELSFVKSGYVTTTRRFMVTTRKKQSLTVALRKRPGSKPARKANFFQRLFGR